MATELAIGCDAPPSRTRAREYRSPPAIRARPFCGCAQTRLQIRACRRRESRRGWRKAEGLQHARIARAPCKRVCGSSVKIPRERTRARACRPLDRVCRARNLSAQARAAAAGWNGSAEHFRRLRREQRGAVAHRRDAIEPQAAQGVQRFSGHGRTSRRWRVIAPRVVDHVATVGGQREIDAQAARRFGEDANLIAGGRGERAAAVSALPFILAGDGALLCWLM